MVIKGTVGGRARDGRLGPNDPPVPSKSLSPSRFLTSRDLQSTSWGDTSKAILTALTCLDRLEIIPVVADAPPLAVVSPCLSEAVDRRRPGRPLSSCSPGSSTRDPSPRGARPLERRQAPPRAARGPRYG
jgi:hypothetical protein